MKGWTPPEDAKSRKFPGRSPAPAPAAKKPKPADGRLRPSAVPEGLRTRPQRRAEPVEAADEVLRPIIPVAIVSPSSAAPLSAARILHQHDLRPEAAARLVQVAGVKAGERVVEPGAGTGSLTAAILAQGAEVWALELDARRCDTLRGRCMPALLEGRLHIVLADALKEPVDPGGPWRVIGNPPFNLTAALLRRWLLDDHPAGPPTAIDLLLQRQAAEKCCQSRWGGHTRTSVLLTLWGSARTGAGFPRDATEPPSHVPLVAFQARRSRTAPDPVRLRAVDRLLEVAFAGPHSVRDALRGVIPAKALLKLGPTLGFDPAAHPRTVPPEAWLNLAAPQSR